jgi:hypothetical protein
MKNNPQAITQVDENNPATFVVCVECGQKFPQITHTHLKKCHGLKNTKEYKQKHGLQTDDLYCQNVRELRKVTHENMIKKYGKEEGDLKWEQYRQKQSESNSFEYKKRKHGWTKREFAKYNASRSSSERNFIKRHGEEEGKRRWHEYVERQRYAGVTLEYFVEKYGKEEGEAKYKEMCRRKSLTLETFIEKYGEEEGQTRWNDLNHKRSRYMRQSAMANELFWEILKQIPTNEHDYIYFDDKNKEYFFAKKGYKTVFVDFFHSTKGKIIEFLGDYWHGNLEEYEPDFFNSRANATAKQLNENTHARTEYIEREHGCRVLVIWENEYKRNREQTIQKCVDFLNN